MRRFAFALVVLAMGCGPAFTADPRLEELRAHFTVSHKPVPPEALGDLGAGDLADPGHSLRVAVDLLRAVGADGYTDKIGTGEAGWIDQAKAAASSDRPSEGIAYKFFGATHNGLLVTLAYAYGGGTGRYYVLQFLDGALAHGFDEDGMPYERLKLSTVRNIALGDRWRGNIAIEGDSVIVTTEPGPPNNTDVEPKTRRFEAVRPPD